MTTRNRLLIVVFLGGAIGTTLRAVGAEIYSVHAGSWPWPTFTANLVGALLLGAITEWWAEHHNQRALLGAGLCGALTTFSTMQLELLVMLDDGETLLAVSYAAASLILGVSLAHLGRRLVDHPRSPRRQAA